MKSQTLAAGFCAVVLMSAMGCVSTPMEDMGQEESALSGTTHITPSYASGQCIEAAAGNTGAGGVIQTWGCGQSWYPNWNVVQVSSGIYEIRQADSGNCITANGGTFGNGNSLVLWGCYGQVGSRWSVGQAGSYVTLRSIDQTNKCIDINNWGSGNGSKVQVWDCTGGTNQQFSLNVTQTQTHTWAWSSSDQWATWSNNGYTLYNDIWGSGAGSQTISADSPSLWQVWANHPDTGGIKSYPNATKYVGKSLSSLSSCTSNFNVSLPSGGAWEATYDIWDSTNQNEIMLWMNWTGNTDGSGNVKPIAYNWSAQGSPIPVYTNVTIGGFNWNVFRGNNGSNNVYSFLAQNKPTNATVDVKAMMNWIKSQGWIGDVTLGNVQFGYEITSSNGGMTFATNSFGVNCY